jgi:hypothetical protein
VVLVLVVSAALVVVGLMALMTTLPYHDPFESWPFSMT